MSDDEGNCKEIPTLDKGTEVFSQTRENDKEVGEVPAQDNSCRRDVNLDSTLEEAAKRRNLSALNVKSIIHHVLKDKRVLALVQRQAAEDGGETSSDQWDLDNTYEPKLTRSRVRQAVASGVASGGISPEKIQLSLPPPLNDTLTTEDSSDDEYDPEAEDSDEEEEEEEEEEEKRENVSVDDGETQESKSTGECEHLAGRETLPSTNVTTTSSIACARQSPPPSQSSPLKHSGYEDIVSCKGTVESKDTEEAMMQETAALLASLSDVILSPIKTPKVSSNEESDVLCNKTEDEEIIAKRTRSKHPLTNTSLSVIEASFVPPDAEDPPTPMELDPEDLEWQTWLNDLLNPSGSPNVSVSGGGGEEMEDGDDDVEYNFLADQEEVEKEEFRNDRAVKISKKEVDDLLCELLNPGDGAIGGLLSGDGLDLTGAYLLESIGLQPQTFLQSSVTPCREDIASTSETKASDGEINSAACYLSKEQSTQLWTQIQQHFQLLMQTFVLVRFEPSLRFLSKIAAQAIEEIKKFCLEGQQGISKESCLWYVPHLEEGIDLIQLLDPNQEDTVQVCPVSGSHPHRIPPPVQDILMDHSLFWDYPYLLPSIAFDPMLAKDTTSSTKYFSAEEDYLLVLGMDHYGTSAWKVIQENLFPTKTARQLQLRVKNQCSNRTGDNAIKHYRKTKKVKIPFKEEEERYSKFPQWVLRYHKRRLEKDKQGGEEQKKKERDEHGEVLGSVLKQSSILQPKPISTLGVTKTSLASESKGSKRNLCRKLDELESEAKRRHVNLVAKPRGHYRQRRTKKSQTSARSMSISPNVSLSQISSNFDYGPVTETKAAKGNFEQLIFVAGLEASDPDVRYAYDYLMEVKTTLYRDHDEDVYQKLLTSLLKAKRERWGSKRILDEVDSLLKPWPHLINLFLHFMSSEECIESIMIAEKADLESAELFAKGLQEKFCNSPIQLANVVSKLKELENAGVSLEKAQESLLPLINAHESLVQELQRFLHQLAPQAKPDDIFEEINLVNEHDKELDDFEEIIVTDSNDAQLSFLVNDNNRIEEHSGSELKSDKDLKHPTLHDNSNRICFDENLQMKHSNTHLPSDSEQTCSNKQSSVDHTRSDCDSDNVGLCSPNHESTSGSNAIELQVGSHKPCPYTHSNWTREQDKLIMKRCLKAQSSASTLNDVVAGIASTLGCDDNEVYTRFQELMTLFNCSTKL